MKAGSQSEHGHHLLWHAHPFACSRGIRTDLLLLLLSLLDFRSYLLLQPLPLLYLRAGTSLYAFACNRRETLRCYCQRPRLSSIEAALQAAASEGTLSARRHAAADGMRSECDSVGDAASCAWRCLAGPRPA
jgi:hypothetical protein